MTSDRFVPFDEFHDQRADAAGFLEAVNVGDVRVIQRGERLRFACEAREPVGVRRKQLRQHLDGHVAIQSGIAGAKDFAHAADAQGRDDLVRPETGACSKCHVVECEGLYAQNVSEGTFAGIRRDETMSEG